ncbi:MAG: type II 3-dehydroquinate dehydratase [Candidatus Omnitrophota bacterium]
MKKILVIHGPNLDLLGVREPEVYGRTTLKDINSKLKTLAQRAKVGLKILQSNHEGEIVDAIGKAGGKFVCILINPAAYTHTSVAIRDAISASGVPTIEVHLSNIYSREEFRRHSLISPVSRGCICGLGVNSYIFGLQAAIDLVKKK